MNNIYRFNKLLVVVGDILVFYLSFLLMFYVSYSREFKSEIFDTHHTAFILLFICNYIIFEIIGLYEKRLFFRTNIILSLLSKAVLSHTILSIIFFYFIPLFSITPKSNLFIYEIISLAILIIWRIYLYRLFIRNSIEEIILVGKGSELREIKDEIDNHAKHSIKIKSIYDTEGEINPDEIMRDVSHSNISFIAVDFKDDKTKNLVQYFYKIIFSKVRIVEMDDLYEEIFERVPVSLLDYSWFFEHIKHDKNIMFNIFKRSFDIILSSLLLVFSFISFPFIYLMIKIEDKGSIFIAQERVGKNSKIFKTYKYRTMTVDDGSLSYQNRENKITKIGNFLRKTRIDELPQLVNVLKGEMSLIGPRPELPRFVALYENEVPYYAVRHLVAPGLSGWAQLYQKDPPKGEANSESTKTKLSYDLYYIKHQSILLDLKIALSTIKTLLSRSGK